MDRAIAFLVVWAVSSVTSSSKRRFPAALRALRVSGLLLRVTIPSSALMPLGLNVELKQQHITVADDVLAPFQSVVTLVPRGCDRAAIDQVVA